MGHDYEGFLTELEELYRKYDIVICTSNDQMILLAAPPERDIKYSIDELKGSV